MDKDFSQEIDEIEDKDDLVDDASEDEDNDNEEVEVVIEDSGSNEDEDEKTKEPKNEDKLHNRKKRKFRSDRNYRRLENQFLDLKRANDQIMAKLEGVVGTVSKTASESIDNKIAETNSYLTQAKLAHKEAVEAGDGERAQKALDLMLDARDQLNELKMVRVSSNKTVTNNTQPANTQNVNRVDPRVQTYFSEFQEENDWYDPQVGDGDSRIAFAIDNVLVAEGYDPRTKQYWDELRSRLRSHPKLKHHYEGMDDDMEDETSNHSERKRPTPPTGRSSQNSPSGKKKIVVSKERAQAMREMGLQPGSKEWNKMATKYASYDKQSA